eukprot:CAMPEP_0115092130 /NCGR_PEP_ID=MMETSP0227-20121206/26552_1 /TAXON_ID=89957 /ORGANISM="Polarella glacialis, Strain CCMP 1383" /LENGTH=55 /DNA_ID=CAMNT_0002483829 /DNA_START=98 /DNA_END=261 /DNA_ORIENTATION=-
MGCGSGKPMKEVSSQSPPTPMPTEEAVPTDPVLPGAVPEETPAVTAEAQQSQPTA